MLNQRTPGIPIPVCDTCNTPMDLDPPVRPATEPDGTEVLVANYRCQMCGQTKQRRTPLKTKG
ncbi:MAG: hypothetical protein QM820_54155 [Minicystis sp.]